MNGHHDFYQLPRSFVDNDLTDALLFACSYLQYVKRKSPLVHEEADGSPSTELKLNKAVMLLREYIGTA